MAVELRRARGDEAAALTALALRSKAWWGYDDAFLERVRPVLTIHPDMCDDGWVVVADRGPDDGGLAGFYQLETDRRGLRLADLFVEPAHIGTGLGRRLWAHAVDAARARGASTLRLEADPHAEAFYRHLGARRDGEIESAPGRFLPLMSLDLT